MASTGLKGENKIIKIVIPVIRFDAQALGKFCMCVVNLEKTGGSSFNESRMKEVLVTHSLKLYSLSQVTHGNFCFGIKPKTQSPNDAALIMDNIMCKNVPSFVDYFAFFTFWSSFLLQSETSMGIWNSLTLDRSCEFPRSQGKQNHLMIPLSSQSWAHKVTRFREFSDQIWGVLWSNLVTLIQHRFSKNFKFGHSGLFRLFIIKNVHT